MYNIPLLKQKVKEGDINAMACLGTCFYQGTDVPRDFDKAEQLLTRAAREGNVAAQFALGCLLEEVRKNDAAALQWYELAAEAGFPEAQRRTADLYYCSNAITRDPAKAAYWYQQAADNDVPEAQFVLGESYRSGILLPRNHQQALAWYKRAVANGYEHANTRIQQFYPNP